MAQLTLGKRFLIWLAIFSAALLYATWWTAQYIAETIVNPFFN